MTEGEPELRLSVSELAKRAGMTVRNIRAHQSRGLLHRPERVGRRSWYDVSHLQRLEQIAQLQQAGFNLVAISALLTSGDGVLEGILELRREAEAQLHQDGAVELTADEVALLERDAPGGLQDLERLGFVRPLDRERWESTHPVLAAAAREVTLLGVGAADMVAIQVEMSRHAEAMARALVKLFLRHYWDTGLADVAPRERIERLRTAYAGLQPMSRAVVGATFDVAMARVARSAFGADLTASFTTRSESPRQ